MDQDNQHPTKETISPENIFSKIWTSPRKVFEFITIHSYNKHVSILLMLSGIGRTFDRAALKNLGDTFPLWSVILFCVVLGGLFGWIIYYVYAALISWTGRWLNGKGNSKNILNVLSYALVPSIVALVFLIPQIAIYGNAIFQAEGDLTSAGLLSNILFYLAILAEFVLGAWTFVLCIIGLSVVQQFSIGKAILNIFLPALLLAGALLSLFLIFDLFAP